MSEQEGAVDLNVTCIDTINTLRMEDNLLDLTLDEDVITDDFVADLINQRFDLVMEQNDAITFEVEESEGPYALETKFMIFEEFEKVLNKSTELPKIRNEINEDDPVIYGPHPPISAAPTCSKFEANKNQVASKQNKNNLNSMNHFIETYYPIELLKSSKADLEVFDEFWGGYGNFMKNVDHLEKKLELKEKFKVKQKVLLNVINNYLDINRVQLEFKLRKIRSNFQTFIRKLINENYHIAYSESEFANFIEKSLFEEIQKMKKQMENKLRLEKSNIRLILFEDMMLEKNSMEKQFILMEFHLYSTLLEDKIDIVNTFLRINIEKAISQLNKDVKNFIYNTVILPKTKNEKRMPFGALMVQKNKVPTIYNEKVTINNNFSDGKDLLRNFDEFKMKANHLQFQSSPRINNENVKQFYDDVSINESVSEDEDCIPLDILKQLETFKVNRYKRPALAQNSSATSKIYKPIIKNKNLSVANKKSKNFDVSKEENFNRIEQRKILKTKRTRTNFENNTTRVSLTEDKKIKIIDDHPTKASATMSNIDSGVPLTTTGAQELNFSNRNDASIGELPSCSAISSSVPALDFTNTIDPTITYVNTNETAESKRSVESEISFGLHAHELLLLEQVKENFIRHNIINAIEKKMKELNQSLLKAYQDIAVMSHEYQKLEKYKQELKKAASI